MMAVRLDLYKWYKYDGKLLSFEENRHNPEYFLELHKGNVFGIRKNRGGTASKAYSIIHKNSPDILFNLKPTEVDRLVEHSHGWSGKVRKITVNAGVGGLDKKVKKVDPKLRVLKIDSSNLFAVRYAKHIETLYVEFRNGAVWAYEGVTEREVNELEMGLPIADMDPSQGRYFIYRIRDVKTQFRIDKMPSDISKLPVPLDEAHKPLPKTVQVVKPSKEIVAPTKKK